MDIDTIKVVLPTPQVVRISVTDAPTVSIVTFRDFPSAGFVQKQPDYPTPETENDIVACLQAAGLCALILLSFVLPASATNGSTFGDIPRSLSMPSGESVRRNAGNTAFEAYTPVTIFTGLSDVPNSYVGQGLKGVRVNVAENALEFYTITSGTPGGSDRQVQYNNSNAFGGITGVTTDGTSLNATLPLKSSGDSTDQSTINANNSGIAVSDLNSILIWRIWGNANQDLFIGYPAPTTSLSGSNLTVGGFNMIGADSSAFGNTAIGDTALYSLTTGSDNTGLGHAAGNTITTGVGNVAVGVSSILGNGAANNIVIIGNSSFSGNGATDNAIAIGANSEVDTNNTAVIGDGSITDVYFGSTSGNAILHGQNAQFNALTPNGIVIATNSNGTFAVATPTNTPTPTATATATFTPTATPTVTVTPTPPPPILMDSPLTPQKISDMETATPSPSNLIPFVQNGVNKVLRFSDLAFINTPTPTPSSTATFTPTPTATFTPTDTPTPTPTWTPLFTATPTSTPTSTPTATVTPTPTEPPPMLMDSPLTPTTISGMATATPSPVAYIPFVNGATVNKKVQVSSMWASMVVADQASGSSGSNTPATLVAQIVAGAGNQLVGLSLTAAETNTANTQFRIIITYSDTTTTTVDSTVGTVTSIFCNYGGCVTITSTAGSAVTALSAKKITTARVETLNTGTGTRYAAISAFEVSQ